MTPSECSHKLFEYFSENSIFEIEKNFTDIIIISDDREKDRALLIACLKQYKENNLVDDIKVNDREFWVLKRPFHNYEQNITLGPQICITMSTLINKFGEATNNKQFTCDPKNISESDVKQVILICSLLMQEGGDLNIES